MLTEERIIKQVTILPIQNAIEVEGQTTIYRDGIVVSVVVDRCAYGIGQKDKFLSEVPEANKYISLMGW